MPFLFLLAAINPATILTASACGQALILTILEDLIFICFTGFSKMQGEQTP